MSSTPPASLPSLRPPLSALSSSRSSCVCSETERRSEVRIGLVAVGQSPERSPKRRFLQAIPCRQALPEATGASVSTALETGTAARDGHVDSAPYGSVVQELIHACGKKSSPLGITVLVGPASWIPMVITQRCVDVEMFSSTGQRHVEETPFLVHARIVTRGHVGRKRSVRRMDQMDHGPLTTLR